jgi:hypothetical protein
MTFFCYIYSHGSETPHMEALDSLTLNQARARSIRMLNEHRAAIRAELFSDDQRVAVISRDDAGQPQTQA